MPKKRRPRRGSLQYWPRKRAKRIYPKVNWKNKGMDDKKPRLLGFAAYKAGMTHVQYIKNGKPVTKAVTVLDSSPCFVCGMRFYQKTFNGLRSIGESWSKIPKNLEKKLGKYEVKKNFDFEKNSEKVDAIRLIICTQPEKSGLHKKKPELFEIGLGGGGIKEQYEYAKNLLGKEVNVNNVFRPGDFCDVTAITKGHGFTGAVKRFGIKIQTRKDEQHHRHPGSVGSTTPRKIDWRVPLPGQYGFFQRTEYNKRIIMINDDSKKINPKGGFINYGLIPGQFILVEGSVPGPKKRLIMLSMPRRKTKYEPVEIKYIFR
ncbi:MAG: 50S ribosomal protein L3 [Candidatus Aenigmarchaeota archaeon]|nr:50S ribosomal protein L3 [Candidatus Aenigmarchaeota archaeon]